MGFPQIQRKQESPRLGFKPVFKPPALSMEQSSFHDHKHDAHRLVGLILNVSVYMEWKDYLTCVSMFPLQSYHSIYIAMCGDTTGEVKRDPATALHKWAVNVEGFWHVSVSYI